MLESRSSRSQKNVFAFSKIFFFVSQILSRFLHALRSRFHCWVRNNEKSIFEPGKKFLPGRQCPRTLASRPTAPWDPAPSPAAVYRVPTAQQTRKIRYRIILDYAGTYRSRSAISLTTCAAGACRQRKMPAPGTHGRVFAGCGHSVRNSYLSCSSSSFCHLRNIQLLLFLSASVMYLCRSFISCLIDSNSAVLFLIVVFITFSSFTRSDFA